MFELVNHIVDNQIKKYKYLIILQPTSPLRDSKDIDNSCKTILSKNFDSLVSVEEVPHRFVPQNIYKKKNLFKNVSKKNQLINRQKFLLKNRYYARNGAAIT